MGGGVQHGHFRVQVAGHGGCWGVVEDVGRGLGVLVWVVWHMKVNSGLCCCWQVILPLFRLCIARGLYDEGVVGGEK